MSKSRFFSLISMIVMAAGSRLIPHPWNFTPITAMALFSGAHFENKRLAFSIPMAAMLASDIFLGFHRSMPVVYGTFALIVFIGTVLKDRRSALTVVGASLVSSTLFFATTNFSVWVIGSLYPRTWPGLMVCYTTAIPFFQKTLLGDLFYTALFFGFFSIAEKWFPVLRSSGSPTIQLKA